MDTATVRLDTLAPGAAFRLAPCGLVGVVEHVGPAMVRVAIQRQLDAPVERTAWAGSTAVTAIPGQALAAAPAEARTGADATERNSPGNWAAEFRSTACPACGRLQPRRQGRGRPRRYCSTECRLAGHRQRRTGSSNG